jgi:phosphatidylinositol-3-phosphatase
VKKPHTRTLLAAAAALAALAAGSLTLMGSSTATAQSATPANPCLGSTAPGHYSHVIVIPEENHSFTQVEDTAPYQASLARTCGLASDMYGEMYPSLPNYIAMTSGTIPAGISGHDCVPGGKCLSSARSIFNQVESWKVYAESMPSNCYRKNTSNGLYVPRHTAAPYFTDLANCSANDVPLGTTSSGAFQADLKSGNLPQFAMVTPNTTDDAHGGCLQCADKWLQTWIPKIVASPAYQNGSTAIFITYDTDNKNAKNHIYTAIVAPSVKPGTVVSTRYNHYAMLHTIEDMLGLPCLGSAATAPSMQTAFHL